MEQVAYVQIRHVRWGLYQGASPEGHVWYPNAETPEMGVAKLTPEEARTLLSRWLDYARRGVGCFFGSTPDSFVVEPFDEISDRTLRTMYTTHYHSSDVLCA